MLKKIIITILILLILGSLGVIGYIVLSQNQNNGLVIWAKSLLTSRGTDGTASAPKVPANFFPSALTSSNTNSPLNMSTTTRLETINQVTQPTITNSTLANTNAIGLRLKAGKDEQILFIDRESGVLYEITPQNTLLRLTENTLTNIKGLYWPKDQLSDKFLTQSFELGQILTMTNSIKYAAGNSLGIINNKLLGTNISAVAISPDSKKIFELEPNQNGTIGYTNDWTGLNKKKIWSFAFGDWQVAWPKEGTIALTTTPSGGDQGYLYFLNPTTGALTKILERINGLTTNVSPDGTKVLFSRSSLGGFGLYLYEVGSKKTSTVGLNTLPEKCLWLNNDQLYCAIPRSIPSGIYPDTWYQGKVAFSDDIWQIDLKQKTTTLVVSTKSSVDLINLVIAPKRGWAYAINKIDNSIQSYPLPL